MNKRSVALHVATHFSDCPGGRLRSGGPHSAQEFLEDHLLPRYDQAVRNHGNLVIFLDCVAGYAASFLEEAFGGLARARGRRTLELVELVSDDGNLMQEIALLMEEAVGD